MNSGGQGWPSGNNKDNKWSIIKITKITNGPPVDEKQPNMRKMTKQATRNKNDSWGKTTSDFEE